MEREFKGLNIAILAVSEAGAAEASAKLVAERLATCGHVIAQRSSIDDSVQLIRAKLLEQIADPQIDVVVVLAGMKSESAGIALDPLITRSLNGFSDLLRMIAYQEIGSAAMLVDAEAAQCKSTFVFILPASLPAVKLALDKLLVPQLDYRTAPRNLVMALPRIAHVDTEHDDPPVAAASAPVPWITPRAPGDAPVPQVFAARQTSQTAVRKSMSMSVAQALPSPSASVSQVIAKASTGLSVNEVLPKTPPTATGSQPLPVENPFSAREITNVGPPPAPPPPAPPPLPLPRNKVGATLPTPLPIKPPAKLIPLAALLPVPADATPEPTTPAPNVVVDKELSSPIPVAAAPARKMSSLADLDDEGDDLDELDDGVAVIVDAPPRGDDEVAKLFDEPPRRIEPPRKMVIPADLPPRRTDTVLPPLYDDSPRRIAEPREPRRSKGPAIALLIGGLVLAAAASVLVVTMVRRQDREARAAGDPQQGELVATRDPAPPPAAPPRDDPPFADPPPADPVPEDLPPTPTEVSPTGPTEAFQPAPDVVQPKANPPGEIEMPAADPGAPKQPRAPKTPRPPRDPATVPVQDPADVLATAPVNKVEDGCDEVSCILDHYKQGCCARFKPPEPEPAVEKPSSGLPEKLDKLMVQDGIAAVKPAVIACGEQFATRGTVRISVKVSPSGKILSAGVAATPDPQLGACVAAAVKLAKFPETDEGGSFAYPFVF